MGGLRGGRGLEEGKGGEGREGKGGEGKGRGRIEIKKNGSLLMLE